MTSTSAPMNQPGNLFDAPDPITRIEAIHGIRVADSATIQHLEQMAINDPDAGVRQAALEVLARPDIARISRTNLRQAIRAEMVQQITQWAMAGRLRLDQWRVLRRRYLFDFANPSISQEGLRALDTAITNWLHERLIDATQAEAMRQEIGLPPAPEGRVTGAEKPPVESGQPEAAVLPEPEVQAAQGQQASPENQAGTRRSAIEILFSEVSIRIALYLGGFLVVAAALILAALIEVARMPILLALTAACGGATFALRKRLPLPANVLFMLFAAMLPIDARVLADNLHLAGPDLQLFWALVWAAEALVLGEGALLYDSRLLSLAVLGALDLSAVYAAQRWDSHHLLETMLATLSLAGLVNAGWMILLRQDKAGRASAATPDENGNVLKIGQAYVLPLVWINQLQTALVLLVAFGWLVVYALDPGGSNQAAVPIPWITGALCFILVDMLVVRILVFPPLTAAALLFIPYTLLWALHVQPDGIKIGMAALALAMLLGGTQLVRGPEHAIRGYLLKPYGPWLLGGAVVLMVWISGWQTSEDTVVPFIYLCLWAVALTLSAAALQQRPFARVPLWITALFAALLAYFQFYALPLMHQTNLNPRYQLLIPALLYLLPALVLRPDLQKQRGWYWPAIAYGLFLAFAAGAISFEKFLEPLDLLAGAVTVTALALVGLAYALRFRAPVILFAYAVYALAALILWLQYARTDTWLLPIAGLAVAHYVIGYALLKREGPDASASLWSLEWPSTLRWIGLGIGLVVLVRLPFDAPQYLEAPSFPREAALLTAGAALLVAGELYLTEILTSRQFWLEYPMDALFIAALFRVMQGNAFDHPHMAVALVGASLIILAFDLFFTRYDPIGGPMRLLVRLIGAGFTALAAFYLVVAPEIRPEMIAALFGVYALYFLLSGLLYPQPWLTAAITGALAGCLFYGLRWQNQIHWAAPLIGLASIEYLLSWWLGRRMTGYDSPEAGLLGEAGLQKGTPLNPRGSTLFFPTWSNTLRLSALALAMIVSLAAPFENNLAVSIPVAAAASLYAIEAFRRRNVWIGFPANGLYLLAYDIILYQLQVNEPQYYSLGVAALGLLMHFLLVRSGSKIGAFVTGMVSQLALLGTTYIQMFQTQKLSFFVILFFQGLVVLAYGVVIRSRSLVITPLLFIVLGVVTVVLSILSGVPTAIIIGCTGITLLTLGILAVVLRDRLMKVTVKMGEWRA